MEFILKARHWQIFGSILILAIIASIIADIGSITETVARLLMVIIYYSWILMLGYALSKHAKTLGSPWLKIFITTGILLIVSEILITPSALKQMQESILAMILYGACALCILSILLLYPAKTLKRLELKKEVVINDYFVDAVLLFLWPIGIWILQPRINKLLDK